ncbi:MAG: hypothetical protein KDA49_12310 [Rhodospirillaceae bacterium]|nr:hypothetical protein [Rhodospirillaceae bacterium]
MFGRATLGALGLALRCAVCAVTWTVSWTAAWAQVEPVNVLQRVDAMGDQVALLRLADGLDGDLPRVAADHPRMPRHVLQQARNVYQRIAQLRWLNGLETDDLVPVPPREIEPADVLAVVDQARAALSGLAPVYGVPVVGELPDRRTQAAPANVMAELRSLSAGLSDLGVPDIVPNDVYRIALALSRHAEGLALARGIEVPPARQPEGQMRPADVFAEGLLLLEELRQLDDATGNRLPGGVAVIDRPGGTIEPGHVIVLLELTLADLYSLSVALGDERELSYPGAQTGRTPTDVFAQVSRARAILTALVADAQGQPQ